MYIHDFEFARSSHEFGLFMCIHSYLLEQIHLKRTNTTSLWSGHIDAFISYLKCSGGNYSYWGLIGVKFYILKPHIFMNEICIAMECHCISAEHSNLLPVNHNTCYITTHAYVASGKDKNYSLHGILLLLVSF